MNHNDMIKDQLQELINTYGIKQTFIANKLNLHKSTISKFLKGTLILGDDTLETIQKYLNNFGK